MSDFDPAMIALAGDIDFDPDALREKYRVERAKRLRKDGEAQYIDVTAEFSNYVEDPYVDPGFTRAQLTDEVEVIVVGGGFSGLLMGARLRQAGFDRIRMIDKAGDFGGTWYWNRYPGACCDIESYVYLPLLEETGFVPRHKYSYAPEILEYCQTLARHFDLYRDTCFQTKVIGAEWDERSARWTVRTDRGDAMRTQFLVLTSSPFDRPKLPGIPGVNDFKSYTFHTSRWDYGYTGGSPQGNLTGLADKRVGIIGTGATGIQCIPHIGASAKETYVFQRTPSSVDVRNNRPTDVDWFRSLEPGWQQERMNNFVSLVQGGEEEADLVADGWTDIFREITGPAAKRRAASLGRPLTPEEKGQLMELADFKKMNQNRARIAAIVNDPATAEELKPWYRLFCKRPCFNDEYLQTFNRPGVTLVDTDGRGIERLTEHGLVVAGREYEVDCLIFATGFEVGSGYGLRAGTNLFGRDGRQLSEHWAHELHTFHGLQMHGFPNCFVLGFTQTAFTFLVPHSLNEQAKHAAYIMQETRDRGADIVEATREAEDGWVAEMKSKAHLGRAFYESCTPGYYNSEGRPDDPFGFLAGAYGGGSIRFLKMLEDWRASGAMTGVELRTIGA
ncbi:NAD(P)/FAD-dependent oxidoreductase [Sphingomonas sp.]|uniref:flavin-containing monooxygenase n=1 Tax=Sphingomonas sp. TaxID=28214 RepID=UPI0025CD7505|nr:NAD(P)/FAD-dependent oxidoreductase [Sphingomonas sp.]